MDTSATSPNAVTPAPTMPVARHGAGSGRSPDQASSGNAAGPPKEPQLSIQEVAAEVAEGRLNSLSALESVSASIDEAVEVLNEALSRKHTSAVIRRDEQLNRFLVTIKDKESGEVVREIPSEALLKFARNLQELRGILFDETL